METAAMLSIHRYFMDTQDMAFWAVSTLSAYPDAGDNCDEAGECHMVSFEKASQSSLSNCQSLSPLHLRVLQKQQRRGIAEMIRTYSRVPEKNHRLYDKHSLLFDALILMNQLGKTRQTPLLYNFTESNTPGVVENPFRE
ncbi:hypothetical protein PENSUB_13570 [Penicillium subrubescens]|uniref:Uncharacterized protein n=1 Tax=Penicillium subrubescens TaxID=1316194 RepID=A0A1Q5SP18_9EURO|nr:hypothetical protein PENSUB_13570 [Penicillium subrubescens]